MCGIAGKIYFSEKEVDRESLLLMTKKIAHRGPDDEGIFISENGKVGLGNRRLAIIDLSQKGHQPMSYKNRYWITTNGEIYNFQPEKEKLQREGYKFFSDCDTEVILALYDKYKEKCLDHMRGMFAFCIYDTKENTLFLARDRIGKKPLKFFRNDDVFVFASEAKAILTQDEVPRKVDYKAIVSYLIYGYIPNPQTGFENIQKLSPGHYIKINITRKTFEIQRYWEPSYFQKLDLSEKEWCKNILETLEEATKIRMISDVPLGALLSGGVDSSGVVSTMALLSPRPINTFTITFENKLWDESVYAAKISKLYKTNHTELMVKPNNVQVLPEVSYFLEEPFADAGNIVSFLVSQLARKYVTVVLNGDGGDENFAGYPNRYMRLKRDVDFDKWINFIRPAAGLSIRNFMKISSSKALLRSHKFLEKSKQPIFQRFISYNQVFNYKELVVMTNGPLFKALKESNPFGIVENCFSQFYGKDEKDAGLKFDLLYWLPDDLLAKGDITSMANSLEPRSPLLDHVFIELACKIPFNLKVKNNESKYIFKKALEKIVPKDNLYRQKRGFGVPLHEWFAGSLNEYAADVMLSKKAFIKDILDTDLIKKMLLSNNEKEDFGPRLWSLLTLELWLENYFV